MLKRIFHTITFNTLSPRISTAPLRKQAFIISLFSLFALGCGPDDGPKTIDDGDDSTVIIDPPQDTDTPLEVVFTKTYGGSQDDSFQDVIATSDGGFAALGYSQSVDGDITDNTTQVNMYWVVKTDADGNIQWSKTYGGSADDRGQQILQTNDGGYALVGFAKSSDGDATQNAGFADQWIVKLDSSGEIQWQKSFGFSGSDQAFSIIQTTDGGYFTAGFLDVTASGGAGDEGRHGVGEFWGHKLDANGNLIWRRYFGGTNNDRAYAVVETQDEGLLLVGATESTDFDITESKGSYDFWAVKLDLQGNLLWQKNYGGSEIDIAYAVTKTQDGNFLLVGDTRSTDGDVTNFKGAADVWLVKIDGQGNLLWQKTLGGASFDTARDATTQGNGFVVTGASRSTEGDLTENKGQTDFWIMQLDGTGDILWQKTIGGDDLDFGYGITVSGSRSIFVAGDTQSTSEDIIENKGGTDAVLIKIE